MSTEGRLRADLIEWWETESKDWDNLVNESDSDGPDGVENLWSGIPEVDSKAVARASPIFKRHLGIPLKSRFIRPGGYESFEAALNDLVPKMMDLAAGTGIKRGNGHG